VRLEPQPANVEVGAFFSIDVTVCRATSEARRIEGRASLSVDASMPEHRHGMNYTPEITRQNADSFRVDGLLFHMPGDWELYFDVAEGGRAERAVAVWHLD
jgi:hypothetical protein